MGAGWVYIGIVAFFVVLVVVLLIMKNRKDKKEAEELFAEQYKIERKFEPNDDDQQETEKIGN